MSADRQKTILLVSAFDAPFIGEDASILSGRYGIIRSTGSGLGSLLRTLFSLFRSDLVFSWFLSVYGAFGVCLARLTGRPSVVVIGGVDVAEDPDLGYGLRISWWRAALARRALRAASLVLVVDESLREKAVRLGGYDGVNIRHLPTGYDPEVWTPGGPQDVDVLCVASAADDTRFRVKGLDLLIAAARDLPGTGFTVVGVTPAFASSYRPPANMTFVGPLQRDGLPAFYRRARVYCQPSRHEGLPNALCEAMLCGCFPVAADVGGCRTAVGDAGILVPAGDHAALGRAIGETLGAHTSPSIDARERITTMFHIDRRRAGLLELVGKTMNDHTRSR